MVAATVHEGCLVRLGVFLSLTLARSTEAANPSDDLRLRLYGRFRVDYSSTERASCTLPH